MKTKIYLTAAAVATLALGSCSQDQVVEQSFDAQPKAIEFGVYTAKAPQSRGLETDGKQESGTNNIFIMNPGFGINATYTGTYDWSATDAPKLPNFMYNQSVTWEAPIWSYSPIKYWPKEDGEKISFFAWAPFNLNSSVAVKGNTSNAAQLDFTVNADASKMVDFVAASAIDVNHKIEAPGKNDIVKFDFIHELTRLNFTASASEDLWTAADDKTNTKIVINSIKLVAGGAFAKYGLYEFDTDKDATYKGKWTTSGTLEEVDLSTIWNTSSTVTVGTYTSTGNAIAIEGLAPVNLFATNQYLFLLPVETLAAGAAQVAFDYDIVTSDSKLNGEFVKTNHKYTVSLTAGTMQQGKAYNYNFKFDVHQVKVEASVADWDKVDGGTVDVPYDGTH